jgi:subtilisin-like proprotein convertase family protein
MRVELNSKSILCASFVALSMAGTAWPAMAGAQDLTAVPNTRVRNFNNTNRIDIDDPCAGLEEKPEECDSLQDEDESLPPLTPAALYPSAIVVPSAAFVSGSKITDVNVTIKGVNHSYLNDVDVLLVGPSGESVVLFSNVAGLGGSHVVAQNLKWKFDDSARLPLPHSNDNSGRASTRMNVTVGGVSQHNPLYDIIYSEWAGVWTDTAQRTFKPSDYDSDDDTDAFPAPAPQGLTSLPVVVTHHADTGVPTVLGGGALSVFNGTSPVGTWSLYVADDYFLYDGAITGGWEIQITAKQP